MDSSTKMHDHVFDFSSEAQTPTSDNCKIVLNSMLFKDLLAEHIFWYCRFRWIVIGVLISFGISSYIDGLFNYLNLSPALNWPFGIAGFAIIINVLFKIHADRLQATGPAGSLLINMWTQIILDLLVLTLVVHFVGSLDSVISFAYLFHIVLSCIFFSRIQSLLVIAFSSILFITCVILEYTGIIPPSSIFRNTLLIYNTASNPQAIFVHIITILSIWYVVWYLVSYISSLVRERDYELCTTNQRLKEAQEEKTKHLLRLTHELKAPFAAIDANIQVIQKGHCGILPFKALELLERIAARSRKLGDVIQSMLQLENVQKMTAEVLNTESLDLSEIIKWCIGQV